MVMASGQYRLWLFVDQATARMPTTSATAITGVSTRSLSRNPTPSDDATAP